MIALACGLASCHLEDQEIPQLELYTRAFIKEYGIPDPEQDWNMAQSSDITLNLAVPAQQINVYVYIWAQCYRVAQLTNIDAGTLTIPIDIPEGTTQLVVSVDGLACYAEPGDTLTYTGRSADGRADSWDNTSYIFGTSDESLINPLGWLVLVEDLGSTDDFDFNDVIFRIECVTTSIPLSSKDWNVIDQGTDQEVVSRAFSREGEESTFSRRVTVQGLAAGGILASYLHFRTNDGNNTDYILNPYISYNGNAGYNLTSEIKGEDVLRSEWHGWFDDSGENQHGPTNDGKDALMINTGQGIELTTATISLPLAWFTGSSGKDSFSMSNYSTAKYNDDGTLTVNTVNGFYITVNKLGADDDDVSNQVVINPSESTATIAGTSSDSWASILESTSPQMMLIPDIGQSSEKPFWEWPRERVSIDQAYPDFKDWVTNSSSYTLWYKSTPTPSTTHPRPENQ